MRIFRVLLGVADAIILGGAGALFAISATDVGCRLFGADNWICTSGFENPGDGLAALILLPLVLCAFLHGILVVFSPTSRQLNSLIGRLGRLWLIVTLAVIVSFLLRILARQHG